jgi:exodeoxyribonuclease VII large subunit
MQIVGERQIFSISEVNGLAKELLEQLSLWVEGEVYDYKSADRRYYYVYFQLKDADGKTILPTIILPQTFDSLGFKLENGQKLLVHGKLTLFTKTGKYQFLADRLELAGAGQLAKELEALKATLQAEGLLAVERKRALPLLPQRIGVVTSTASDAWADFQRHSIVKFPLMELYVADAFVQGPKAVNSLLRAIELLQTQDIEVLVITRGGGSLEDLAAFNDEKVVRAIAASTIPTLVGVGHEKDVSIADLVADVRASTPTNAGQILTAGYEQALSQLQQRQQQLQRFGSLAIGQAAQDLDQAMRHLVHIRHKYQGLPFQLAGLASSLRQHYHQLTHTQSVYLAGLEQKFHVSGELLPQHAQQRLTAANRQLQAVSPLAILQRGYSLVEVNDQIVRSSAAVKQGDTMHIRLHRGGLRGLITRVED